MFQDWENIPDFLISECSLHREAFAYFEATDEMDEETAEAFEIYCKQINYWPCNGYELEDQLEGFRESYRGFFGGSMKDATLNMRTNTSKRPGCCQVCHRLLKGTLTMKLSRKIYF